ncbi:hypothetical protein ACWIGI_34365 [Nocardia sp. NPDC055321]
MGGVIGAAVAGVPTAGAGAIPGAAVGCVIVGTVAAVPALAVGATAGAVIGGAAAGTLGAGVDVPQPAEPAPALVEVAVPDPVTSMRSALAAMPPLSPDPFAAAADFLAAVQAGFTP